MSLHEDLIYPVFFNERDTRLIKNCRNYSENDPAGLPGHQVLLIVERLDRIVEILSTSAFGGSDMRDVEETIKMLFGEHDEE